MTTPSKETNSALFSVLADRARRMGFKIKGDRYVGGVPVHDDRTRYHIVDGNGHGMVRAAGLQIRDLESELNTLAQTGQMTKDGLQWSGNMSSRLAELAAIQDPLSWAIDDPRDLGRAVAATHAARAADIAALRAEILTIVPSLLKPEDLTFELLKDRDDRAVRVSLAVLVTSEGFARETP